MADKPNEAVAVRKSASIEDMLDPAQVEDDIETPGFKPIAYQTGTPAFDKEDIAYPRLRLAQQQTPEVIAEEAKAGQFVMSGFEPLARAHIVPLMFAKTRKFAVGTGNDRKVACQSADSVHGTPIIPPTDPNLMYGGICEECPANKWTAPKTAGGGKNKPPLCDVLMNYIVYVVEHGCLAEFQLKKTGITTAKMFNTIAAGRGFGYFIVEVFGGKENSPNSPAPFWAPKARVITRPTPELLDVAGVESLPDLLAIARTAAGID